jgi:hypothetical protein
MLSEDYSPLTEAELTSWEESAKGPKDWSAEYILHLIAEIRRLRKILQFTLPQRRLDESRPIWEEIVELMQDVPEEEWANLPADGSVNLDHYLYGAPRQQE